MNKYRVQILPFVVTVEAENKTDAKVKAACECEERGLLFDKMEVEEA